MKIPVITSIYPDSIRIGINVKLSCSTVVAATGYRFQVSRTPGLDSLIIDTVIITNEYTACGMGNDNTCYFRIAGVNAGGNGPWSSSSHFTTLREQFIYEKLFKRGKLTSTIPSFDSEILEESCECFLYASLVESECDSGEDRHFRYKWSFGC
ncbi:MAG: fibronectin type III domain-containing protein [Clostridiaceae bacterium]|jgi:hypothetical protein|nr:fibronectin type III domain-containing protein [Clostridiaceae bacterium]